MNTHGQSRKSNPTRRATAKPAVVSMTTRALQRLFPAPDPVETNPGNRQRPGNARAGKPPSDPTCLTHTPLAHLKRTLDSLPHGRSALRQLHAVELELVRGGQGLVDLGPALLGSALCQLNLLQCKGRSEQLEALRATLERAAADARATGRSSSTGLDARS